VTPTPPCFAKKRLDVVENKGLALKNAEKRGCIVLKTLRWFCSEGAKKMQIVPRMVQLVEAAVGAWWPEGVGRETNGILGGMK
jgi:hypothetical protein